MANRFQASASRIIDGNFGSLKLPFTIIQSSDYDYDNQEATTTFVDISALKRSLSKTELETQDIQLGDFALIFTDEITVNVDRDSGIFDGVPVEFVTVLSLAADAAQTIIARVK